MIAMADPITLNKHIGNKIRHFRRDRDLTITKLGELVCKSKSTISKYEAGEISIDITTLYDIAEALQISPLTLLPPSEKKCSEDSPSGCEGNDHPELLYLYTYNGLVKEHLRRHVLLVGATQAEHFADIYDYENYTQCGFHYRGEVQRTESSVRLFMENVINPLDRCILTYPTLLSQWDHITGMMTSISTSQYPPFSIKFLLSRTPVKDENWLTARLILSKDEWRRMKKKNSFYIISPELERLSFTSLT